MAISAGDGLFCMVLLPLRNLAGPSIAACLVSFAATVPVSETANDVHEALSKAHQMYETRVVNVSIEDQAGHRIDGDELLECLTGKKKIAEDLRAV